MKKDYIIPSVEIFDFLKIETSDEESTTSNVTEGNEGSVDFWK